jgi:phospholipase C
MPDNSNPLSKIQHVVVVMLENRSFDNLLGWLYDPANPAPFNVVPPDFEGLSGKNLSNRAPDGRLIPVGKTEDPHSPQPNPGEPFEDVYSQVYDVALLPLHQVPPVPSQAPNMQGFIRNYAVQKDKPADAATIMQCLTPKTIPVLSALAHNYALCDHWFSSIPTQTFCNRSFVHAGTSSGYVNNQGGGLVFINDTTTIFDLLENAHRTWQIFCGGWLLESFSLLTQKHLWKYALTPHFAHFNDFLAAAARPGGLPNYSFIEPVYFDSIVWGAHNDMHPECNIYEFYGPSNLHKGEALLWKIYNAVRNSPDWDSTLLVIVFDEHGGCYDHVAPPSALNCPVAIAPDKNIISPTQPGGAGFQFDRLGPRVPAIIVSAYTPPQTRLNAVFEHTSVLKTVLNCFDDLPQDQLGERTAAALDLSAALTQTTARTDQPAIPKPDSSLLADLDAETHAIIHSRLLGAQRKPISDLQKTALQAAAILTNADELPARIDTIETELQADLLLAEHEAKFIKSKIFTR